MTEEKAKAWPLEATVLRGKDIKSWKTLQNKSDPDEDEKPTSFATIKLNKNLSWSGMNVRGRNPVWNTYTTFDDVNLAENPKLRVEITDVGPSGLKNVIGGFNIPADLLSRNCGYFEKWFPLNDDPSHSRGLIKVKMIYKDPNWADAQALAAQRPPEKLPAPMSPKSLQKWKLDEEAREASWWLWSNRKEGNGDKPRGSYKSTDTEGMDTEQLLYQAEKTKGESISSTRRALSALEETRNMGADVSVELEKQGVQMKGVINQLDTIDALCDDASRKIRGTKSLGGAIANLFTRNKAKSKLKKLQIQAAGNATTLKPKEPENTIVKNEERQAIENRNRLAKWKNEAEEAENQPQVVEQKKKNKKERKELLEDREPAPKPKSNDPLMDEIDENLDAMLNPLKDLKKMALKMGEEINDQTESVGQMTTKTATADYKIRKNAARLGRPVGAQNRVE